MKFILICCVIVYWVDARIIYRQADDDEGSNVTESWQGIRGSSFEKKGKLVRGPLSVMDIKTVHVEKEVEINRLLITSATVPTRKPSYSPSKAPSRSPSRVPSRSPSRAPSRSPSLLPTLIPLTSSTCQKISFDYTLVGGQKMCQNIGTRLFVCFYLCER